MFVIRHTRRDEVQKQLAQAGIGTLIHYPVPPHLTGAYKELEMTSGDYPITEQIANTILSLPMGPHLSVEDLEFVIHSLQSICG